MHRVSGFIIFLGLALLFLGSSLEVWGAEEILAQGRLTLELEDVENLRNPFLASSGILEKIRLKEEARIRAEEEQAEKFRLEQERLSQQRISEAQRSVASSAENKIKADVVPELPAVSLTGIFYETERPMALIDGKVYEKGDEIPFGEGLGSAQLLDVRAGEIELVYVGISYIVSLKMGVKKSINDSGFVDILGDVEY